MRSLVSKTLLALPLLLPFCPAGAADTPGSLSPMLAGWYFGASVGQSRLHTDPGPLGNALSTQTATPIGLNMDRTDTGWKLRAGYKFAPNLAVEGGYVDFGQVDLNGSSAAGTAGGRVKASGINLDLVARMPVGPGWTAMGKAGLMYSRLEANAAMPGASAGETSRRTVPGLGVGVEYALNPKVAIRGEWERYFRLGSDVTGKGDADLLSVGLNVQY